MPAIRRFIVLLDLALLIAWITFAIVTYERLPETIPTHFGPSGAADAFSTRSIASWFALPAIGVCTTLLVLVMAQWAFSRPAMYNVPGKQALLALPKAQQRPFVEQLAMFMTLLATSVLLIFVAIHYDSWRVAMGAQNGLSAVSWTAIGVNVGGLLIGLPLWLMRFGRLVSAAAGGTGARQQRVS